MDKLGAAIRLLVSFALLVPGGWLLWLMATGNSVSIGILPGIFFAMLALAGVIGIVRNGLRLIGAG